MHTLSSASRTCIACESAVEWTATVGIPSSRQARWMRKAISPRLAMRILPNTYSSTSNASPYSTGCPDVTNTRVTTPARGALI